MRPGNSPQPQPSPADARIATLAERQHGLVTAPQLRAAGLGQSAIQYRLGTGRLHRVHRGVYAVGHYAPNERARLHAAVLAVGKDAVLSHVSAAALWRLIDGARLPRHRPVDVTTSRCLGQRPGIRVHRSTTPLRSDRTRLFGIPITKPARTLVDITALVEPQVLRRAVREAEVLRLADTTRLPFAGRHGAPRLRELTGAGPVRTRSELKDRTLALLLRHGFPGLRTSARVTTAERRYEVDFLFPDARVVIEADGERYHGNRLACEDDAEKQAALEAAGYRVVRVDWRQVMHEEERTVARLRRVIPTATSS